VKRPVIKKQHQAAAEKIVFILTKERVMSYGLYYNLPLIYVLKFESFVKHRMTG
jgi:hypothetical protein